MLLHASILVALVISLGAWALASPIGADPDGDYHLTSIWCGSGFSAGQCEQPTDSAGNPIPNNVNVPVAVALAGTCNKHRPSDSSICSFSELDNKSFLQTTRNNEAGLYPKIYYFVASKFVGNEISSTAISLRFINILIFVSLVICLWKLAPRDIRDGVFLTLATLLVPLGIFLIASNNPHSWTISGISFYWAFLVIFLSSSEQKTFISAGLLTVLTAIMAAGSRADGASFIIFSTVVGILITVSRNSESLRLHWIRLAVPLLLACFSVSTYLGASQHNAATSGLVGAWVSPRSTSSALFNNIMRLPAFFMAATGTRAFVGDLGWLDVQMPELIPALVQFSIVGVVLYSLKKRSKFELSALTLCVLAAIVSPLILLNQNNLIVGEEVQARYFLPLFLLALGVLSSGIRQDVSTWFPKKFRNISILFLAVAYGVALHTTMRRYITGSEVSDWNLNHKIEWWWKSGPPPMMVWYVGTISFTCVVAFLMHNIGTKTKRDDIVPAE